MRYPRSIALALTCGLITLASCGHESTTPDTTPATITLSQSTAFSLAAGSSMQLSASVRTSNGALVSDASISWYTSDTAVANINSAGIVSTRRTGTTTLTAAIQAGPSASVTLTVTPGSEAVLAPTLGLDSAISGLPVKTPTVSVRDLSGNLNPQSTISITASVASGPGVLSGTTTVAAVGGVATFSGLVITGPGTTTLVFSAPGVAPVNAAPLRVVQLLSTITVTQHIAGVATGRLVVMQPVVELRDTVGQLMTADTATVLATVQLGTANMSGTTSVKVQNGVATFTNLEFTGDGFVRIQFFARVRGTPASATDTATVVPLGDGFDLDQFVLIPAGTFVMGAVPPPLTDTGLGTLPKHTVNITHPFYMQKTEVTQDQWKSMMGSNPSTFTACGDDCPVDHVSWNDVQTFLQRLNQYSPSGGTYRLPTEAEWEYAARAGAYGQFGPDTAYKYGDPTAEYDSVGWFSENSGGTTHIVGMKKANAFGLYDMLGNVWEWVSDYYSKTYYSVSPLNDPQGPGAPDDPLNPTAGLRGSAWEQSAMAGYLGSRNFDLRSHGQDSGYGFRLVRDP